MIQTLYSFWNSVIFCGTDTESHNFLQSRVLVENSLCCISHVQVLFDHLVGASSILFTVFCNLIMFLCVTVSVNDLMMDHLSSTHHPFWIQKTTYRKRLPYEMPYLTDQLISQWMDESHAHIIYLILSVMNFVVSRKSHFLSKYLIKSLQESFIDSLIIRCGFN